MESLELVLPAGAGRLARIDGEGVSERVLLGPVAGDQGRERWRVGFQSPVLGNVVLFVSFATQVQGFDKAEGAAKASMDLPRVQAGEGCERERGTLAVFSSDSTEISGRPVNLHAIEVTEVPAHPQVKPAGRPLFAFTYAGNDWKLGLDVVRHAPATVLSAIVEQLGIESSVGKDGVGRHVATFELKNLSHQFFHLRVPADAQIWSVLVDGEGVKPAEDAGSKIVPITKTGSPDKPLKVTVSYEVRGGSLGTFGKGALEAPALLLSRNGDVVPVLKTSWKLSLPDDFRYVEFSGNADGPQATVDQPIVVQAWQERPDLFVEGIAALVLVLGIAASERMRTSVLGAGAAVLNGFLAFGVATGRGARNHKKKIASFVGVVALILVFCTLLIGSLSSARRRSPMAQAEYAKQSEQRRGFFGRADGNGQPAPTTAAPMAPGQAPANEEPVPAPEMPAPAPDADDARAPRDAVDEEAKEKEIDLPADKPTLSAAKSRPAPPPPPPASKPASRPRPKRQRMDDAKKLEKKSESGVGGAGGGRGTFAFDGGDDEDEGGMKGGEEDALGDADKSVDGFRENNSPAKGDKVAGKKSKAGLDAPGPRVVTADKKPEKPQHLALAKESAFGAKGLRSLVLELPNVGASRTFVRDGGPAEIQFSYVSSIAWRSALVALAVLGFGAGVLIPRRTKLSYVGLLIVSVLVLQTVPTVLFPSLTGAPVNAFVLGLLLAAPVMLLLAIEEVRQRRIRVTPVVPNLPSVPVNTAAGNAVKNVIALLLAVLVLAPATAQADEKKPAAQKDRVVFVPYDPEHPDKKSNKVFVPEDVYHELWQKANPGLKPTEKRVPPAAYAISAVTYEGTVGGSGLSLKASFRLEVLQDGWVEAPLGLEGAGIRGATIAPEGARLVPAASGFAFVAKGPATFDVTVDLMVPRSGDTYSVGAVRAGAAVARIGTPEADKAIKVLGAMGGQVERPRGGGGVEVEASLGAAPSLKIAFGAREAIAHGGGSEASARSETVYAIRRGRIEATCRFTFDVSGEGRDGFTFSIPEGFEVTRVVTEAMRSWRVTDKGILEVALRRPSGRRAEVLIQGERATSGATLELPEVHARNVSRDEGRFGVGVESGLRVRFGAESAGLRQVDPSDFGATAPVARTSIERGYAFSKRPAAVALELLEDALELKSTSRVLGIVHADRYEVRAEVEYQVKHGRTFELRILAPEGLELEGDPTGLDVRERLVETVAGAKRYTFGLAKALVAPATACLRLKLVQTLRADDSKVSLPDVRALGVSSEDGEVALCAAQGLRLRGDGEPERFQSADPEGVARRLQAPSDTKPQLGWTRRKAPTGISSKTASIEHPKPHVEGTLVTFATVERDVVRTVARVYYDLSEAGCKVFRFGLPARLARRAQIHAPNQREVTFAAPKDDRVEFTVELQSAVENFYEVALEWEELVPPSGQIDLARLDLIGCDRARGFVLVQADPSLTEKLELSKDRSDEVERARPEQAYALPPGKGPRDFGDFCFRADKPGWAIGLDLKKVETQAPAPARVETARVTSIVRDDGNVVHQAVYRVRNRSLQFLSLKLPAGADVWTVHVAGEPKRMHREGALTLVPLPKRADADMGFEVEVVYKTKLEGPLGLMTKVAPQAPALATKDVTVERTFWSIYLPPRFDTMGWNGNVEETHAAVGEVESIKAKVRELAKLSEIAQSGAGANERQIAYDNLTKNYKQVQQEWTVARSSLAAAQSDGKKGAQVAGQLARSGKDLGELEQALIVIDQQQQARARDGGYGYDKKNAPATQEQLEVVYEGNKFQASRAGEWRLNDGAFKRDRAQGWAGLEGRGGQQGQQVDLGVTFTNDDQQSYSQNRGADQQQALNLGLERGRVQLRRAVAQQQQAQQGGAHRDAMIELYVPFQAGNADVRAQVAQAEESRRLERLQREREIMDRLSRERKALEDALDEEAARAEKAGDATRALSLREQVKEKRKSEEEKLRQKYDAGGKLDDSTWADKDRGKAHGNNGPVPATPPAAEPAKPAEMPPVFDPTATEAEQKRPQGNLGESLEKAEAQKALLSIGFRFEVPQNAAPHHYTTTSNAEEMQVAITVVPQDSVERAGKIARSLVVVLVLVTIVRLGLLRREHGKNAGRALGLIFSAGFAGLSFVHPAFAAGAVLASVIALVKSRA